MSKSVQLNSIQRELGSEFRKEAVDLLEHGIETVPSPLFNKAVETVRKQAGDKAVTVDAVVDFEMSRAMKTIGRVNEPKGERGHKTVSRDEVNEAAQKDKLAGPAIMKAYQVLLGAGNDGSGSVDQLCRDVQRVMQDINIISESDSPVSFVLSPGKASDLTGAGVMKAFKAHIDKAFTGNGDSTQQLTAKVETAKKTKELLKDAATIDPDFGPDDDYTKASKAFGELRPLLDANLSDVRFVKIGPKADDGSLATDHGFYLELYVGKTKDGRLAGVSYSVVET
jgi:hypothetical protein